MASLSANWLKRSELKEFSNVPNLVLVEMRGLENKSGRYSGFPDYSFNKVCTLAKNLDNWFLLDPLI